ncbi:MAG TPA: ComEC/Rec2 family competence protein [Terriglobales bacterium]|nr:ComEC/Rec2 family competence protein [Terriglobales bacterium]
MNTPPPARRPRAQRQPLLWAALAFAAGLAVGQQAWRPPTWWLAAFLVFAGSAIFFSCRRARSAFLISLGAVFFLGALTIQVRHPARPSDSAILQFSDGREVMVTAHVTAEGNIREQGPDARQRFDVETERVESGKSLEVRSGIRLSLFSRSANREPSTVPMHLFRYGERLRFAAKLNAPRNYRNPGAFDYQGYLAENGIVALASADIAKVEILPGFSGSRAELWRTRIHDSIIDKIHAVWPAEQAVLMDAMVIGEDAFLNRHTRMDFQRSGTYHVLVVSGMNVTILALFVFYTLRQLRLNDLLAAALTVALVAGYALVTNVGSPVWRAALMLAVYFGARLLYREKSMLNAIGTAALAITVVNPLVLFGASFQLTFLCVWLVAGVGVPILERTIEPFSRGLRYLRVTAYDFSLPPKVVQFRLDLRMIAGRLERFFGEKIPLPTIAVAARFGLGFCQLIVISLVMQAGLALPMAYYFHRATTLALPANMVVVPLTELLMPAAALAVGLSYVSVSLAKTPAWIAGWAAVGIAGTVHRLGGLELADVRVPTPGLALILAGSIALAVAMIMVRRRPLVAIAGLSAFALSAFFICVVPFPPQVRAGALEVTAIDVGQGDSLLVVSPRGRAMLVDAGGLPWWTHSELDIGEDVVSPYLWSRGFRGLDTLALTHPHADHIGGMAAVMASFHPRELWIGNDLSAPELQPLLRKAHELGVKVVQLRAGDVQQFGGMAVRILAPDPAAFSRRQNDESLVMKLTYGKTSALLEGDAEKASELQIANEQPQADLLKVGHHGSATSTIPQFLAAVHPRFAVISVGARNIYGHPREEVLARLENSEVATARTDLDGATTYYLDGKTVTISVPDLH